MGNLRRHPATQAKRKGGDQEDSAERLDQPERNRRPGNIVPGQIPSESNQEGD